GERFPSRSATSWSGRSASAAHRPPTRTWPAPMRGWQRWPTGSSSVGVGSAGSEEGRSCDSNAYPASRARIIAMTALVVCERVIAVQATQPPQLADAAEADCCEEGYPEESTAEHDLFKKESPGLLIFCSHLSVHATREPRKPETGNR